MYNQIIGFVGPTGSGKSYTAAKYMSEQERVVVYQLVTQDSAYLSCADAVFQGDLKALAAAVVRPQFKFIYKPAENSATVKGNRFEFPDFELFVRLCFQRRNMAMIVDEAHFLCNPKFMPAEFWQSIVTGRHQFLDIAFVTQRFAMVHHDMTANAKKFFFWRSNEPADLDGIGKRCGREIADRVATLRPTVDNRKTGGALIPGEVLVWDNAGNVISY
jgi:hypothetical protein